MAAAGNRTRVSFPPSRLAQISLQMRAANGFDTRCAHIERHTPGSKPESSNSGMQLLLLPTDSSVAITPADHAWIRARSAGSAD